MTKNVQTAENFSNLIRLNWTIPSNGDNAAEHSLLDEIGTPILLLDTDTRLVYSNHAGNNILRQSDGLLAHSGILMTITGSVTTRLHSSVRMAITTGRTDVFAIPRRSGRLPFVVRLTRVVTREAYCLATIVDPEASIAPDPSTLVELFNLTFAEARLAVALSKGETVHDVAEQFKIKVSTVRSHLRTVFAKTGASRQSDLVRMVLTIGVRLQTP